MKPQHKKGQNIRKPLHILVAAALAVTALLPGQSVQAANASEIKNGDVIQFGEADDAIGFTAQWIVLDNAHTNTGEEGMFLLASDLIGTDTQNGMLYKDIGNDIVVSFDDKGEAYATEHPDVLDYQTSDIKKWCDDFTKSHFTDEEQAAMIATYKSDAAFSSSVEMGERTASVDFDAADNVLNGDQLFLLSAEEAKNEAYGFTDNDTRLASLNGKEGMYWLRSPHTPTFPLDVGMVFANGSIMDFPVNAQTGFTAKFLTCARPAFNLDTSKITKLTATGTTTDGKTIWTVDVSKSHSIGTGTIILISLLAIAVVILLIVLLLRKKKRVS